MTHTIKTEPPLDAGQIAQWKGLLGLYDVWLEKFATGRADEVRDEIADRAAYCRAEIARSAPTDAPTLFDTLAVGDRVVHRDCGAGVVTAKGETVDILYDARWRSGEPWRGSYPRRWFETVTVGLLQRESPVP